MTATGAPKLMPFLLFDGNCSEAMEFYRACLGGELAITRVGDMTEQAPRELRDRIAYARLTSGRIEISATDWQHPTRKPAQGNTVAMYVDGGSPIELKEMFQRLSEGADKSLLDELRATPFGTYGHLADKFGVHWFFRGDV